MRGDSGNDFCVHIQHTAFFLFLLCKFHNLVPKCLSCFCRTCKEGIVTIVRSIIHLNKVPYIYFFCPISFVKRNPLLSHKSMSSYILWLVIHNFSCIGGFYNIGLRKSRWYCVYILIQKRSCRIK